ncbi:MAG TPA: hypothetical protein VH187_08150 [Scandinavium sp.]|jgi:Skp family chaperone for outer membrane proteins|uniref:OmpH family outer membrane protein n=1 Tax=Scandinavium sp. TaxID=2830653 RepID=UPI002E325728|nr:hypothetical protein [Scandinavium sp.]HEX4501117.1 hypothetical protein [Scandinavium sp.]
MFINSKRIFHTITLSGLIALSLTACDQAGTAQQKIAYVDMSTVLKDSVLGKQETEHNQKVKERLLSASKAAETQYKEMPVAQQEESRRADAVIINRQWQAEQQHARFVSIKAIRDAVEAYRQKNKIDMVLTADQVLSANKESDITKQIIGQLADSHIDYGRLPEITTKDVKQPATQNDNAAQDEKSQPKKG